LVVDVADEKAPPIPEADQVMTFPAVATASPLASWSCAVTVTDPPAVGVEEESVTP
jgi:hypothetical protein